MKETRHPRHSRHLLAIATLIPLLALAVQSTMAEPASGARGDEAVAQNGGPKDGAHSGDTRDAHGRASQRDRDSAPADANELSAPPIHRVSRKPYVFPRPRHALSAPVRPQHWPIGVNRGPARNAIGIVTDRGSGRTIPGSRPLWLAASPTGFSKGPAPSMRLPAPTNISVRQSTGGLIVSPPRAPGITGTGMARIGSGPGTIGGTPRTTTGINGTSFRPKHGG